MVHRIRWYLIKMVPHVTHSYVRHDSFICATWLIHKCNMTNSYVRHDSFISATWQIHMCDMTPLVRCLRWHASTSFNGDVWHDYSYVRHDSSICATWRIHMCDMTHSYVRHDSFICATGLLLSGACVDEHEDGASFHGHMWHESFIRTIWLMTIYTDLYLKYIFMTHDYIFDMTALVWCSIMCVEIYILNMYLEYVSWIYIVTHVMQHHTRAVMSNV